MALVEVERSGAVVMLTLNRPDQRNAVSVAMLGELGSILGNLAVDGDVRVLVLAGAGQDFCAGADVGELAKARRSLSGAEYGRLFEEVLAAIGDHPVPVIARIHGAALGAGCQLAVACDLAVAAEDARMGIPSVRLGIVINYENIERLVLSVGPKRAAEILYTGRAVSGIEAADWGLVNLAVPSGDLAATTAQLAGAVAAAAPLSVRGSKRGVRVALANLGLDETSEGHRLGDFQLMAADAFASQDMEEGLTAFLERRRPDFKGV